MLVITTLISKINAQDNQIELFTTKIDSTIIGLSKNSTGLTLKMGLSNRKVRIIGMFNKEEYIFTQRIKHYKGGTKKEKIVVRWNIVGIDPLLMKIVRINDEYFYIKYNTYSPYEKLHKIAREKLIDGRIYRSIQLNYNNTEMMRTEIWEFNKQ